MTRCNSALSWHPAMRAQKAQHIGGGGAGVDYGGYHLKIHNMYVSVNKDP